MNRYEPRAAFRLLLAAIGGLLLLVSSSASGICQQSPPTSWLDAYSFQPLRAHPAVVAEFVSDKLPRLRVTPAALGRQIVRASLPLPAGALAEGIQLKAFVEGAATENAAAIECGTRVLTYHPGKPRWARRALVTFAYDFANHDPIDFTFGRELVPANQQQDLELLPNESCQQGSEALPSKRKLSIGPVSLIVDCRGVTSRWEGGQDCRADVIAPSPGQESATRLEVVEHNTQYLWVRWLIADEKWPRILDLRADCLGTVILQTHLQRREPGDAYAPDFGWQVAFADQTREPHGNSISDAPQSSTLSAVEIEGMHVSFPLAARSGKGAADRDGSSVKYLSCSADDRTPFQSQAWRRAVVAIQPAGSAPLSPLLLPSHRVFMADRYYDAIYGCGHELDLRPWPELESLRSLHRQYILSSSLMGDDFGNVTGGLPGGNASVFGMNRLNHCPSIFEEYYRCGDVRLKESAVLWCENMHDLSIWWGDDPFFGGTRYNNAVAAGENEHEGDTSFMWRTNGGRHTFCTKGYDSFFYAYEETGDPRMTTALRHQIAYAKQHVHVDRGEARNIGDVADFMRLYRFTGLPEYLDEAKRLWSQLLGKLNEQALFSQSGKPIVKLRPYIDNDQQGYDYPFAKPYIIGYALSGCPWLFEVDPEQPRLLEMLRSVSQFMVDSLDDSGGWRYPAPESSQVIIGQGMEHAAQLVRVAVATAVADDAPNPAQERILDAVEIVLQARLGGFLSSGQILSGLGGWELTTGQIPDGGSLQDLYSGPEQRDRSKDYELGAIGLGAAPPEATVYFTEVLAYYLRHRPAERLWNHSPSLQKVLDRLHQQVGPGAVTHPLQHEKKALEHGVQQLLPSFNAQRLSVMNFPGRWNAETSGVAFSQWRENARQQLLDALGQSPPRAGFDDQVLSTEDRGTHTAYKIQWNVNSWQRVLGYLLVPKGSGPFPAILALHDHGAHFSIGKEKVVRPFDVSEERLEDAQQWVDKYYGGRWIGDELASRGFVVFATDALFWGDRGESGGSRYETQQALAANLFQLGMSWAGTILWDDLRSAEYLQSRTEVIPSRIGAVGLSMGAYRTWNLAAASDVIQAGAAICWLGDTPGLAQTGNNQTRGQSAYSMIQPYLRNSMDYADVASIACPKPMLFFNGSKDALFPVESVERTYERLQTVWQQNNCRDRLQTRMWPAAHEFNIEMQEAAFQFFARWLPRN